MNPRYHGPEDDWKPVNPAQTPATRAGKALEVHRQREAEIWRDLYFPSAKTLATVSQANTYDEGSVNTLQTLAPYGCRSVTVQK